MDKRGKQGKRDKRDNPPIFGAKGTSRVLLKTTNLSNSQSGPTLNRLTVLWVNNNGVPFNTTGFNAALFRGDTLVQAANFDRFGVVFFSAVSTLTTVSYTIETFDSAGRLFRTRTIPAGVEAFAIIG